MNKYAQEYRSPKINNSDTVVKSPKNNLSEIGYRSPKNKKNESTTNSNLVQNKNTVNTNQKTNKNLNVEKMQMMIRNLSDNISNQSGLINSFLSSFSTTKTDLVSALNELTTNVGTFITDGKWGKNSQKALVNVLELAASLINVNEELDLKAVGFDLNDFNELKNNLLGASILPNNLVSLTPIEQNKRSVNIQKLLVSLMHFYNDIVNKLNTNEKLSFKNKIIDSGSKIKDKVQLSNLDNALISNINDFYINIQTSIGYIKVPLLALKDKESYLNWINNKLKISNQTDAELWFNRYIKPQAQTAEIMSGV